MSGNIESNHRLEKAVRVTLLRSHAFASQPESLGSTKRMIDNED